MSEITSRPYQPKMACERCCFGRGSHAEFCEWRVRFVEGDSMRSYSFDPEKWRDAWQVDPGKIEWTYKFSKPLNYDDLPETSRNGICRMEINGAMPQDTIAFFSPRRRTAVTYDAKGNELSSVWEPEEEWLKRCAVITNVKVPR